MFPSEALDFSLFFHNFPSGLNVTRVCFGCLPLCILADEHCLLSLLQCIMFSLPWYCAACPLSPVHISPLSSLLFIYVTTNHPPNPFGPSLNTISSWQPSLSTGKPVFLSTPSTMPSCFETLSKLVNAWNLLPAPQTRFELYEGKDCVVCSPPISPLPSMVLGTWKLQHLGWLSGMNE